MNSLLSFFLPGRARFASLVRGLHPYPPTAEHRPNSAPPRPSWSRVAGVWLAGAALAGPLGVVLHELAHVATAAALGVEGPTLHFASSGFSADDAFRDRLEQGDLAGAAEILPLAHAGAIAVAGIVSTWAIALASAWGVTRSGPRSPGTLIGAVLGSAALLAPARTWTALSYLITVKPHYPDARPNFDEFLASETLHIPVELWVAASLLVMAVAWVRVGRHVGRYAWVAYPCLAVGTVVGMMVWLGMLGPRLLP